MLTSRSLTIAAALCAAACGDTARTDAANLTADANAPVEFIALRIEEVSATRAAVRFDTSRPTSCRAEFGSDESSLDRSATDPNMEEGELSIDHEVPLEDLLGETTYHVRAVATDAAGRTGTSELVSFTTRLAVDDGGWMNVALAEHGTRVAARSSNWAGAADDGAFGAQSAVDGLMATEWSSDGDGDDAWLELELEGPRELVAFGYRSRMMADGSSIVTSAELELDGQTRLGPFATPDPARVYRFDFSAPVVASRARFRVRSSTGGNTGAREIQLFVGAL